MSVVRNPASPRNTGTASWADRCAVRFCIVVGMSLGLLGCESAEKYQKTVPQAEGAPEPVGGELALSGSREQMTWVKNLAEALDAARLKFDLRDTLGAITAADSLAQISETALDTLPIGHSLSNFLSIYIADVCGTLQDWHTARGNHEAVSELSRRYQALAARLQERRDSAATQAP